MSHHQFAQPRHSRTFGKLDASSLETGLHEQLLGTQAAASQARRGRTLRLALGFAAFGIAAAIWSGPNMEEAVYQAALAWQGPPADDFTTASVSRSPTSPTATSFAEPRSNRYIVRRSVLQAPGVVCVVTDTTSRCE